ncbi:MAG: helix-turn-helix domain-containing protein, partial [Acidimicrobiia bacterium]|nr:helix-turn-helix domain-containing protein [Acidimicrobiia bacterium]
ERLAETTDSLSKQLGALEQARSTQTTLSRLLLDGEGADAVTRTIATKLNAGIALLSAELQVISQWPRALNVDDIVLRLRSLSGLDRPGVEQQSVQLGPNRWLATQAVRGGSNHLGWFCAVLGAEPGIGEDLVISEAATVTALCLVIERAAEVARADHRQSLVWNLIEGTVGQRRAAVDQARWLRVDIDRARRLIRGEIISSRSMGRASGNDREYEEVRQRVLAKVRGAALKVGVGELVAARGNDLAIIVPDRDLTALRSLVAELDTAVAGVLVDHDVAWGVSGPCSNLLDLDRANAEAISAVKAATRLGLEGTTLYEDLGVVRLIVSNDDGDLQHFLHDIIGPLLRHDAERNSELVDTLRAYFAADYSHADAAERLHIHHKTFGYRLSKIEALTGLDLRGHEGRMQADLALKLHDVSTGS